MSNIKTLNAVIRAGAACEDDTLRRIIKDCARDMAERVISLERMAYVEKLSATTRASLIDRCNAIDRSHTGHPKIAAIKLAKKELNLSLIDAKHWVEQNTRHV